MSNESFFDKVKDFVTGHPEQADQGLDKAEEVLDERTGGQHTEQIAQGEGMVREKLGMPDGEATVPEPGDPPAVPEAPSPTPGTAPEPPTVPTPTEPPTVPTPTEPTTTPPVPSPDPVPTAPPETVPEAAPDTSS